MTAATTESTTDFPHPDEEFMEIVGFPQYLVSTYGRVFSVRRKMFMKFQVIAKTPRVAVTVDGKMTSLPLPPTVLTAFGNRPIRRNAKPRFRDGDPNNCALANLEWA